MPEQERIVSQTINGVAELLREHAKAAHIDDRAQRLILLFIRTTLHETLSASQIGRAHV